MASEIKTYPPVMGSSNLKAYYRFETGALTTDSSAGAHTLTAIGGPDENASGQFGGAATFVAANTDAYSAVDHADFKPTGAFTIGCWIKPTSHVSSRIFQSYSQNVNNAGIQLYTNVTDGTFGLQIGKNTGTTSNVDYKTLTSIGALNTTSWQFVVATWDTQTMALYLNGQLDNSVANSTIAPVYAATNYVRIGCRNQAGTNALFLNASLDDVFLINGTALSAQQVSDIYNENCNKFFQLL